MKRKPPAKFTNRATPTIKPAVPPQFQDEIPHKTEPKTNAQAQWVLSLTRQLDPYMSAARYMLGDNGSFMETIMLATQLAIIEELQRLTTPGYED